MGAGMTKVLRRLALVAALAACLVATFAASAWARPAPADGASLGGVTRSLAYNQPLNEQETGEAAFIGSCELFYGGNVSGSPISNGEFIAILLVDCSGSGSRRCLPAFGFLLMADSRGEIEKEESGSVCVETGSPSFTFAGSYTIQGGTGAYAGAEGNGTFSKSFDCDLGGSCSMSGTETSDQQPEGPIKKGDDPTHVLLCSPTLVQRGDGSMGNALQVPWADYQAWLNDATTHPEIPAGSIPAKYGDGIGLTCDNLPGYVASGKKADEQGTVPDDQTGPLEGAIYPYWVKG
jgi:hypothetical protein